MELIKHKLLFALRYPGGKGKLSHYVQLLIEYNPLTDGHYVEPYAGGASVALLCYLTNTSKNPY